MTTIFLFTGGYTDEREISLKTANTFIKHLNTSKYKVFVIDITQEKWTATENGVEREFNHKNFCITSENKLYHANVALNALHGPPGENGWLQGLLAMHKIPTTTGDTLSMALSFNKKMSIDIAKSRNCNVANSFLYTPKSKINPDIIAKEIGYPLFVKPNCSGSSLGISKVEKEADLFPAIDAAFKEGDEIMVESFLSGTEITCGIFKYKNELITLPPTEIRSHNAFFDYQAKYLNASDEITPAEVDPSWITNVQNETKKVYQAFNCKGICRVDFMVNANGIPFLIEINTVPGMSAASLVPQQLAVAKIPFSDMLDAIIEEALAQ